MKLTIYADDTFSEENIREVRQREQIKIPYRVGQYVVNLISAMDLDDDNKVFKKVLESEEHITAIVRATFGLRDEDLDYINVMELVDVAKQIIAYVTGKMAELGVSVGGKDPNPQTPATTA